MPPEPPRIPRQELFRRLAEGHAARLVVLVPNRRLAASLQADFDRLQLAAGRISWEAPDILPFATFLERCHDEASHAMDGEGSPALLRPAAERLIWEDLLRAGGWDQRVVSVSGMAALAAEAWALAHAWRLENAIEGGTGGEDAQAFAAWAAEYRRRTQRAGAVDAARLPRELSGAIGRGELPLPTTLVLYAFDLLAPAQRDFVEACERAGAEVLRCGPPECDGLLLRVELSTQRAELERAARWARERLEGSANGVRIGIVVPALASRRAEVARVFARVFAPNGAPEAAPLFNISLGAPLANHPLAGTALELIELCGTPVPYDRASRLLRSPFVAGAESERVQRALADAALREMAPATITLKRLRGLLPDACARRKVSCPGLVELLDRLLAVADDQSPTDAHGWAGRFAAMLDAAGFPGERSRDSAEHQALERWGETLGELAALASIAPRWSGEDARGQLRRLCIDALFQPASGEAPVQVLGVLESAGLCFDHLWVSGLTEDAWPLAVRPHPLIAPSLQQIAGIPQASAEGSLELDRALTAAWTRAAPEVIFSSARGVEDRELLPSPLIAAFEKVDEATLPGTPIATRAQLLQQAGSRPGARGSRADTLAPPVAPGTVSGGTRLLADQAACPFRAFAHFRLAARGLENPVAGLDARERGILLHELMASLWRKLRDRETLRATSDEELGKLIDRAAGDAVAAVRSRRSGALEDAFADLEHERLVGVAREWLEIERARKPFEVHRLEERVTMFVGGLQLTGRVDRVDRLLDAQGGLAVIDYKAGKPSVAQWLGARPEEPQLPLYALVPVDEEIRAVAFAKLKVGELGFLGLARDDQALPGVRTVTEYRGAGARVDSWSQLLAGWSEAVEALGEGYASGDARVDPRDGLATCALCDLAALCRVHERLGGIAPDEPADEA